MKPKERGERTMLNTRQLVSRRDWLAAIAAVPTLAAVAAGVKTLVLSHIGPPSVSDASWQAAAGKYFKGEIIVMIWR